MAKQAIAKPSTQVEAYINKSESFNHNLTQANLDRAVFMSSTMQHLKDTLSPQSLNDRNQSQQVYGCILKAAQLGVVPGTHCSIVPFGNRIQLVMGYKGVIYRLNKRDDIRMEQPRIIYEGDDYELPERTLNDGEYKTTFHHKLKMDSNKLLYVYVIWREKDVWDVHIMSKAMVDKVKSASRAQTGPWTSHYDEMARKTVVKQAVKYLNLDPGLETVMDSEDIGLRQGESYTPQEPPAVSRSKLDDELPAEPQPEPQPEPSDTQTAGPLGVEPPPKKPARRRRKAAGPKVQQTIENTNINNQAEEF